MGVADSTLVPFQALFGWDSFGSRILDPALASQAGNGLPGNIHQLFFSSFPPQIPKQLSSDSQITRLPRLKISSAEERPKTRKRGRTEQMLPICSSASATQMGRSGHFQLSSKRPSRAVLLYRGHFKMGGSLAIPGGG